MRLENVDREVSNGATMTVSPGSAHQPRRRQIYNALALALSGVVLALIVAEVAFRLLGIGKPGMYQWDTNRGWGLRPGATEWQHREGGVFVQINREGMRDHEHAYSKPADTIRVAFIGDSFTEAEQVAIQDDFVSVAEHRLGTCDRLKGKKVEALNFGCDSYGTAQEFSTLKRKVWKFDPDFVVLVLFPGNDLRNNSIGLERHLCQPFYSLHDNRLVLTGPFVNSPIFRARCMIKFESRGSAALNVIGDSIARIRSVAKAAGATLLAHRPKVSTPSGESGVDNAIYRPPQSPDWETAWKVTEKLLPAVSQEVKQHGAQFLLVTASVGPQVYPNPLWRARFEKNLGVGDLFYAERQIRDDGERGGLPRS